MSAQVPGFYTGASVSPTFMQRWRTKKYVGGSRPVGTVWVRRGFFAHRIHNDWPDPQFGRIVHHNIRDQFYPKWTPTTDWVPLPGVVSVDLDQSFDKNGTTVATIKVENNRLVQKWGVGGSYHVKERGYLWPWKGYAPVGSPGSSGPKNEWYNALQNAQILITQGYGGDTMVKTFTGMIDNIGPGNVRPDQTVLTSRDFGSVMSDIHVFAFNKDKRITDPIYFVTPDYFASRKKADPGLFSTHKRLPWILVNDVTDIVRCALRWSGFQEWQIEDSGVNLKTPFKVEKSQTWADVINTVATQLGYVFFIGEPSNNDSSIGVPIFRRASAVVQRRRNPVAALRSSDLLTDCRPQHDNSQDRYVIRVRGQIATRKRGGRSIIAGDPTIDGTSRITFTYWPPWAPKMSGVIKQLTYYNIGAKGTVGFQSKQDCEMGAIIIATQIALGRDTVIAQCPGQPGFGLDAFAFVQDEATGVTSRVYITNRKSTMTFGGGSSSAAEMMWTTEIGGSLIDNPEWDQLVKHYEMAQNGQNVVTGGSKAWT